MTAQPFVVRQENWCKATGMKPSKANPQSVLRWLPSWRYPSGLDQTGVYYWPAKRVHILITEPYHSTDRAIASLMEMAESAGGEFSSCFGAAGSGLWYPGACFPVLVACLWAGEFLPQLAAALPSDGVE